MNVQPPGKPGGYFLKKFFSEIKTRNICAFTMAFLLWHHFYEILMKDL